MKTKHHNSKRIFAILVSVALSGAVTQARAGNITFAFGAIFSDFPSETLLTGTYTFDPTVDNTGGLNGFYEDAVVGLEIAIGPYHGTLREGETANISILPAVLGSQYAVLGGMGGILLDSDPVDSITLVSFGIQLFGTSLPVTPKPPTSPPTFSPVLPPLNISSAIFLGYDDNGVSNLSVGEMSYITSIPEPDTFMLFGFTLIIAALFFRRRKFRTFPNFDTKAVWCCRISATKSPNPDCLKSV